MNEAGKNREPTGKNRLKRVAAVIVLAVLGFVGLGSWAIASPVGSSPDDDYHLVSIWCSWGERDGLCEPGATENQRMVPNELLQWTWCYASDSELVADCNIKPGLMSTDRGDFANNYPPVYYRAMGVFASENVEASTVAIRIVNAAIFVVAISLLMALLRRGQRGPLFWPLAVALVPLGMFIVPSVNPSSWAVVSGLTIWVALAGYFKAETRARQIGLGAFAVTLTVMGAGARGDAGIYAVIAAGVAMILTFSPTKQWLKLAFLPVIVIAVGALFFLTTGNSAGYATNGVTQAQVEGGAATGGLSDSTFLLLMENFMLIPSLWAGSLGTWALGWFEVSLPETIPIIMIGAFSALAFRGFRVIDWRKALTLSLILLALFLIPAYILYGIKTLVGTEVQPRYILPLVLISIGVALYGFKRDDLGLTVTQVIVLILGVSYANSLSLFKVLRRYLTGTDYPGINLNSNIEWWWATPISPMLVWLLGSVAFGISLFGTFLFLRESSARKLSNAEAVLPAHGSFAGTVKEVSTRK